MIDSIQYDQHSKTVVGWRRAKSGKNHKDDDAAHFVFGDGGLYQLVELYQEEGAQGQVMWPTGREEWARRQREDPELEAIMMALKATEDDETYKVRGHEVIMEVLDGIALLKRKYETVVGVVWQTWVPGKLQELCMQLHHEQSAHPGMDRTLSTMKINYFWETMRIETQNHCAGCRMCELRKAYHGKPKVPVQKYPGVACPFSRMHIDLTGELPTTDGNGSKYIMVVKDYHTKFVWLFALKNKDAISVADMLVTELYCRWGIPETLVSDRGSEFRNKLEARIAHIFRVNKIATTPYNPRANGFVEQHNKTLKDQLYNFVDQRQKDWDVFLPTVQLMYNTTVSMTTLRTPYYLMFGRECNMPHMGGLMDRKGDVLVPEEGVEAVGRREATLYEDWEDKLVSALQLAWEFTTDRAYANASRGNKAIFRPRGLDFKEYEEGQWFYRKRNQARVFKSVQDKESYKISRKLQARWEGPYRITRKVSPVLYEAIIDGVKKRVHAINMKPKAMIRIKHKDTSIEDKGMSEVME
jgi:transposase InsO family protein